MLGHLQSAIKESMDHKTLKARRGAGFTPFPGKRRQSCHSFGKLRALAFVRIGGRTAVADSAFYRVR